MKTLELQNLQTKTPLQIFVITISTTLFLGNLSQQLYPWWPAPLVAPVCVAPQHWRCQGAAPRWTRPRAGRWWKSPQDAPDVCRGEANPMPIQLENLLGFEGVFSTGVYIGTGQKLNHHRNIRQCSNIWSQKETSKLFMFTLHVVHLSPKNRQQCPTHLNGACKLNKQ